MNNAPPASSRAVAVATSFDQWQSIYTKITGKKEKFEKHFDDYYQVSFVDIEQLQHRLAQVVIQYGHCVINESITIVFEDGSQIMHSGFDRFRVHPTYGNLATKSIHYEMEFGLQSTATECLESYKVAATLRSGSMLLDELGPFPRFIGIKFRASTGVAKVEYENFTKGDHLFKTVCDWFDSLAKESKSGALNIIQKYSFLTSRIFEFIGVSSVLAVTCYYVVKIQFTFDPVTTAQIVLLAALLTYLVAKVSSFMGRLIEASVDKIYPNAYINISAADQKRIEKTKTENKKNIVLAVLKLCGVIIIAIFNYSLKYIFDGVLN